MLTLNQATEILKNFTFKHKQLGKSLSHEHFYFGTDWEEIASGNYLYPLSVVIKEPTVYTNNKMTWRFVVDISDKVNLDRSNETHVISDTEQICLHLIYYLKEVSQNEDFLLTIGNISEITSYNETRGDDQAAGNYFSIEISAPVGNVACDLPINAGNIFDDNYIYISGSTTPITSNMSFATEEFIYGTDAVTLSHTPTNILTVFAGASPLFVTDDYTRSGPAFTITNPLVENGDKIRITYTY